MLALRSNFKHAPSPGNLLVVSIELSLHSIGDLVGSWLVLNTIFFHVGGKFLVHA